MKTKLFYPVIPVILVFCFYACNPVDKQLQLSVDLINKTAPVMVDEITRLDGAEYLSNKTLKYNYTFVSLTKEDLDMDIAAKFKTIVLNNVQTNPQMEVLRKNDVIFIFNYKDKENQPLLEITITPEDYR
jgi:hypothetical protein